MSKGRKESKYAKVVTATGVVDVGFPPLSPYGTHTTVMARSWPLLGPFFRQKYVNPFKLFHPRSTAFAPQK